MNRSKNRKDLEKASKRNGTPNTPNCFRNYL
jgi:hypothetical protein